MVVLVQFQAANCMVPWKPKGIQISKHIVLQVGLAWHPITRCHRGLLNLPVPCMISNLWHCVALRRLSCEEFGDQVFGRFTDVLWRLVICSEDFLIQGRCVLVLEWQVSTHERKKNHPTAPEVTKRRNVAVPCYHLWSCIAWRTTSSLQQLAIPVDVTQSKINYLDVLVLI